MISCWTDGNSSLASRRLSELFPQARIQGKGLIATEGFVSLPWESRGVSILAVRSHFLEFLPINSNDEPDTAHPRLAHELETGQHYSVTLTTGGGFYRYHLADTVEMVGREQKCPLVRFLSRRQISDWCGEKLHEAHVARVLSAAFVGLRVAPSFAMLACDTSGEQPHYVLYLDADASDEQLSQLAGTVESGLQENFHYRYARRLGQLGPLHVFAAQNAETSYAAAGIARGQRAGNIKPAALDSRTDWTGKFQSRAQTRLTASPEIISSF